MHTATKQRLITGPVMRNMRDGHVRGREKHCIGLWLNPFIATQHAGAVERRRVIITVINYARRAFAVTPHAHSRRNGRA